MPGKPAFIIVINWQKKAMSWSLLGIAIIGVAGSMKAASLSEEEKKAAVKDFNFPKALAILAAVRMIFALDGDEERHARMRSSVW